MELKYRGISYEAGSTVEDQAPTELVGKYRGLDWRFRNRKKALVLAPNANLKYRGVSYSHGMEEQAAPAQEQKATVSLESKSRDLLCKHTRNIKKRQQSMLSRAARTIGLSAADNYWNRIQGKVHPSFRASYDRVGATMS